MKKRIIIFSVLIVLLIIFFIVLQHVTLKQYRQSFDCLDTTCEITVFSKNPKAKKIVNKAVLKTQALENEYREEIEEINQKEGTLTISNQLYKLLQLEEKYQSLWNNNELTSLWKRSLNKSKIPTTEELKKFSLTSVQLLKNRQIKADDFDLNIDGILSGKISDEVSTYLEQEGFNSYMINYGGNITVGKHYKNQFTVSLYMPITNEYFKTVPGNHLSIYSVGMNDATVIDGIAYTPVINNETKYPYQYHTSVTVIDSDPIKAQLLSNLLFSLSLEEGKKIALEKNVQNVIWVENDQTIEYLKDMKA